MAHTSYWPSQPNFYPFGNTSPVSFLESIPRDEDADVLLLGCGDPRNILHSLQSFAGDDAHNARRLDITCCDMEPGVLARNMILYTLVLGAKFESERDLLWNIFFDVLLDDRCHSLLLSQSRLLANLSVDMDTWEASKYSTYLKMASESTLDQLHDYWCWYARSERSSPALKTQVLATMKQIAKEREGAIMGSTSRSAGPMWMHATASSNDAYHQWWNTGLTSGDREHVKAAVHLNPTFAYSARREGFFTHFGNAPVAAFHLATAYTVPEGSSKSTLPETMADDVHRVVRAQFQAWCDDFRSCVGSGRVTLRFGCCDFISLCATFRGFQDTGKLSANHRVNLWTAQLLSLHAEDGSKYNGPTTFDVVDTSNLADHAGMVNILLSASPLLKNTPWATFYTETLLQTGADDPTRGITTSLCGDLSSAAMLFDLAPVSYISGFETHSNVHEFLAFHIFENGDQYYERLVWKRPSQLARPGLNTIVSFEQTQLGGLLFNMYLQMFRYENVLGLLGTKPSATLMRDQSTVHYSRRTLALLIHELKRRIAVDWDKVVDNLLTRIEHDKSLLLGMVCYQDLLCELHLLGIYSAETFLPGPYLSANKAVSPFKDWLSVPPVVCVVFSVPRSSLNRLDEPSLPSNLALSVNVAGPSFENRFCHLETFYGTLAVHGRGEHAVGVVAEDPRGFAGSAPWTVAFWAPAWMLMQAPQHTTVRLNVINTVLTSHGALDALLGHAKRLFCAPLLDAGQVRVLACRPSVSRDAPVPLPYATRPPLPVSPEMVQVNMDSACRNVTALTLRAVVEDADGKAALASKTTTITTEQVDHCEMLLKVGDDWSRKLVFTYPVHGVNAKLRIARKSGWIEVVAPMCKLADISPEINPFPVIRTVQATVPWNVHRVCLDKLPKISVKTPSVVRWLGLHLRYAHSDQERKAIDRQTAVRPLAQVKHSLFTLFTAFSGYKNTPHRSVFALTTSEGEMNCLIFVTGLRLDLAAHTVVADAFALPLTLELRTSLSKPLQVLRPSVRKIELLDDALALWKSMLPALAERCRDWSHDDRCSAITEASAALCACGQGKVTDAFRRTEDWTPFAEHATRVALGPLFAVSFLEDVGKDYAEATQDHGLSERMVRAMTVGTMSAAQNAGAGGGMVCNACARSLPEGKRMVCSRCRKVTYCSRECQASNWKAHKRGCVA